MAAVYHHARRRTVWANNHHMRRCASNKRANRVRQIGDCALFLAVTLALMLVWLYHEATTTRRTASKRVPPYTVTTGGCLYRNYREWDELR